MCKLTAFSISERIYHIKYPRVVLLFLGITPGIVSHSILLTPFYFNQNLGKTAPIINCFLPDQHGVGELRGRKSS